MSYCLAYESCSKSLSSLSLLLANYEFRSSTCLLCWLSNYLISSSLCSVSSLLNLLRFLKSSLAYFIWSSCCLIVALSYYSVISALYLNSLSSICAWSTTSSLESSLWQSTDNTSFSSFRPSIVCYCSESLNSKSIICSSRCLALSWLSYWLCLQDETNIEHLSM